MIALVLAVLAFVILGSVLALAEASISRMTAVRAMTLRDQGYRQAALLEKIESDPARYLNAVYLSVTFAQNGSAILVALLAQHYFTNLGITLVSIGFTLGYFVVAEAMAKTFGVLHSDRVALALAPFVWFLGRTLALPTRALIGLANILLPGKGLAQGPFVTEADIRSMAEVGHREGGIKTHEKEMINSVFQLGERTVRDVMMPRADIAAIELPGSLDAVAALMVRSGFTRIPAYRGDFDHIEGIVHAKDVLDQLHRGRRKVPLADLLRPVHFVPESKGLIGMLREMQAGEFHVAIVSDEYGSVSGLVTLENLLEELVGQIRDEHDREAPDITALGDGRYRINAAFPIEELNEMLKLDLPHDRWNTVGGLVFGLVGTVPEEGASVQITGMKFTVEKVKGRRIVTVLLSGVPPPAG